MCDILAIGSDTFSSGSESYVHKGCPTKHAPDAGDSAAFSSFFLRPSIFPVGRRSVARPSAVTQTVGQLTATNIMNKDHQ
jgi:hypothetical protein